MNQLVRVLIHSSLDLKLVIFFQSQDIAAFEFVCPVQVLNFQGEVESYILKLHVSTEKKSPLIELNLGINIFYMKMHFMQ